MRPLLLLLGLLAALLAGIAATGLLVQLPPVREAPEAGTFDAERARARLAIILGDERPHPADSFANDAVRARLLAQIRAIGLTPIVRDQFACNEIHKRRGVTCARVRNVMVALGPAGGKALLLNTHYDSSPAGPGAADAGAGVATLLEVASILKGERLQRPVIFLFNEGEELGLVGARAFLADPLSSRVDSLINLEARGTTGPVTMFETSLPNGPPVRAFAEAVDRPFANSLATDFYRQLPNYTDVNSFAERGWLTLNFGFIGNESRYHSPGDDLAALDPRSLQHMGDQTLAVARELSPGSPRGGGTLLFMDIAGRQLLVVPQWAGFALLALLGIGFAAVSYRRGGAVRGLLLVLTGIVAAAALGWATIWLLDLLREGSFWRGYPLWTQLAVYSCGLLAAVIPLALIGRRVSQEQLRASFWLAFLLLGAIVLAVAPGGVIYFLFPPLIAIAGIFLSRPIHWAERAASIAAALLLWLTLGEVLALLTELMSNGPFFVFAPLALLIAMPWLIEAKALIDASGRVRAIDAAGALVLVASGAAAAAPAYSADRQQRFTIQYAADATSGRAYWLVTNDGAPLPERFGGIAAWRRGELPHLKRKGWIAPAAATPALQTPRIEALGEQRNGSRRTVAFRIDPNGAESVMLVGGEDSQIRSAGSGGFVRPIARDATGDYYLTCFGRSCSGRTMQLTTDSPEPVEFTLIGTRRDLPSAAAQLVRDRPGNARPQYTPDSTLTVSRIRL